MLFFSTIYVGTQAQYLFSKGDLDLNLGLGFFNNLYPNSELTIGIPPISATIDYALEEGYGPGVIGIGGIIGFSSFKDESTIGNLTFGYKYSALFIGARGTYHLELVDNLDTYGGLSLYYISMDEKMYGTELTIQEPLKSKMGLSLIVGGKYYFTDKLAVFGELGYNIAWLTAGVTFRLN